PVPSVSSTAPSTSRRCLRVCLASRSSAASAWWSTSVFMVVMDVSSLVGCLRIRRLVTAAERAIERDVERHGAAAQIGLAAQVAEQIVLGAEHVEIGRE